MSEDGQQLNPPKTPLISQWTGSQQHYLELPFRGISILLHQDLFFKLSIYKLGFLIFAF